MQKIDSNELKKLQVEMLDVFDAFCKKNGIRYWLDFGTLLGAVRHKGFIPWDDDVDIAMLREDYEKAAELFNAQSDGLIQFQTPFNNKDYAYPFGKLVNTKTVLYEYGTKGIVTGVYVDVFVYDHAPDDAQASKKIFKKRDFLGRIRRLKLPIREGIGGAKKIAYVVGSSLLLPISRNSINRKLDKNARKYEKVETNKVSSFADPYDSTYFSVDKATFLEQTELEFEGKLYPAPKNYDYWLQVLYGNYMELPPVEKRVNQHTFEAYFKEENKK